VEKRLTTKRKLLERKESSRGHDEPPANAGEKREMKLSWGLF